MRPFKAVACSCCNKDRKKKLTQRGFKLIENNLDIYKIIELNFTLRRLIKTLLNQKQRSLFKLKRKQTLSPNSTTSTDSEDDSQPSDGREEKQKVMNLLYLATANTNFERQLLIDLFQSDSEDSDDRGTARNDIDNVT